MSTDLEYRKLNQPVKSMNKSSDRFQVMEVFILRGWGKKAEGRRGIQELPGMVGQTSDTAASPSQTQKIGWYFHYKS